MKKIMKKIMKKKNLTKNHLSIIFFPNFLSFKLFTIFNTQLDFQLNCQVVKWTIFPNSLVLFFSIILNINNNCINYNNYNHNKRKQRKTVENFHLPFSFNGICEINLQIPLLILRLDSQTFLSLANKIAWKTYFILIYSLICEFLHIL